MTKFYAFDNICVVGRGPGVFYFPLACFCEFFCFVFFGGWFVLCCFVCWCCLFFCVVLFCVFDTGVVLCFVFCVVVWYICFSRRVRCFEWFG